MSKYCPHCHCNTVVKFGIRNGRQRYRCISCKKTWMSVTRPQRLRQKIWNDFVFNGFRVADLVRIYDLSKNTIRSILSQVEVPEIIPKTPADVIAMDCTYFGREYGLLIVIDVHTGKCLYLREIGPYETIMDYQRAIIALRHYNVYPKVCIIDGKKGMANMLEYYGIKCQICQFHQLQTVNQYLTKKPILTPNIELRNIALTLGHVNYHNFSNMFTSWRLRHQGWLKEKTYNADTGRREYTHKDTRKAARSILTHLPYLFTYEQFPELKIPNTNNQLEGINSTIKDKLRRHRGINKDLKLKLVRSFLSRRTEVKNNR